MVYIKITKILIVNKLTCNGALQFQQNSWLHLSQNILTQPLFFSIGILHLGQRLIKFESNIGVWSVTEGHGFFGCHIAWHPEQNLIWQVGHTTQCNWELSSTWHTVSHPCFGHHLRLLSNSTSVN